MMGSIWTNPNAESFTSSCSTTRRRSRRLSRCRRIRLRVIGAARLHPRGFSTHRFRRHDAGESFSTTLGNKTLEQLDVILSSHVSIEPEVADSESYSEFMRSNGARPLDFELWNSVFYESKDQEVSLSSCRHSARTDDAFQNNTVTFCLSLAKIDAETADIESLIYFALSVSRHIPAATKNTDFDFSGSPTRPAR